MMISYAENPALYEVLAALISNAGKFVKFQYTPLPECYKKPTPSKKLAQADTELPATPEDKAWVKGFMPKGGEGLRMTKDGAFTLTLRNMNRKKKMPNGEGYYRDKKNRQENGTSKIGFKKKEYFFRTYRLDVQEIFGVDLATLTVSSGKQKDVRLFPRVADKMLTVEERWTRYVAAIKAA